MKISASGGGGFSGISEHYEVDTAAIPNGDVLEELLRSVDFLASSLDPVGADIPHWDITIEDGGAAHTITFAEDGSAESAPFQALLEELRASA